MMAPSLSPRKPVMIENSVVLPAPFGPIRAVMRPASAVNDARSRASEPPKRFDTCSIRKSDSAIGTLQRCGRGSSWGPKSMTQVLKDAGDAARRERDDKNQNAAINDEIEAGRVAGHELGD